MSVHQLEVEIDSTAKTTKVFLDGKQVESFSTLTLTSETSPFGFSFDMVEVSNESDLRKSVRLSASSIERIKELKRRGVSSAKISELYSISIRHVDYICAGQRCVSKNESILQKAFHELNKSRPKNRRIDISQAEKSGVPIDYANLNKQLLSELCFKLLNKKKGR